MTDITELTSVQKNANIHRLSRLIAYASNDELRQLAVEVEQYTDQVIEALEKALAKNALAAGGIEATAKLHERIAELESEVEKWKQEAEVWERVAEKKLATAIELESRADMLERQLVDHVDEELLITIKDPSALDSLPKTGEVQTTNFPAIPDGYVIAPKEATLEMIKSGASAASNGMLIPGIYKAMLAAADCSIPMISDRWIPVSEQMPPSRHEVLVGCWWGEKPRWCCKWATYIPGHPDAQSSGWLIPGGSWTPTHWMQLPAGPQEVKGE
ncbi:TPA: DUF551 domain-containing protein [Klebsiella quasipneumoniae subsp. similipneumoniae]